jgi:hypothetical protein
MVAAPRIRTSPLQMHERAGPPGSIERPYGWVVAIASMAMMTVWSWSA